MKLFYEGTGTYRCEIYAYECTESTIIIPGFVSCDGMETFRHDLYTYAYREREKDHQNNNVILFLVRAWRNTSVRCTHMDTHTLA